MRVAKLLTAIANWLESPQNEALLLAEYDDECLEKVAEACAGAALVLRAGAFEADQIEPTKTYRAWIIKGNQETGDMADKAHTDIVFKANNNKDAGERANKLLADMNLGPDYFVISIDMVKDDTQSSMTPEALDNLNSIITAFDRSGDDDLQKTASALDELLLIATPPSWISSYKQAQQDRLDVLKKDYDDVHKQHEELRGAKEGAKAIEKSPFFKEVRIMDHALNTRTCPDHPGAQMARVGEAMWQCSLDKGIFNYTTGYTTERGEKVPGQYIGSQPHQFDVHPAAMFDTRQDRIMGGK